MSREERMKSLVEQVAYYWKQYDGGPQMLRHRAKRLKFDYFFGFRPRVVLNPERLPK